MRRGRIKPGDLVRITKEKAAGGWPRVFLATVERWVNSPEGWKSGHWLFKEFTGKRLFKAEDAISIEKVKI